MYPFGLSLLLQRIEGGVEGNLPAFRSSILPILFFLVAAEDKP